MRAVTPKPLRCAVYTRKSTEHNLDLAFNSLDAQREACEAYIKSQAHEGWGLLPQHYDDGGLSGASLARPALKELLQAVQDRKLDVIVVYKVDRLTRSLADFAKLVEIFDEHGASFVSVTQSFNTTSSMGRLTLNVLLSFAQFEREVIGERVRDKIAASKRKGLWVGGPVPLGYRTEKKTLFIEPKEAETVRTIFQRYLALGSLGALACELDRKGNRSRPGFRFSPGALAHLLKNGFYIGDIAYRGEVHRGEHPVLIDPTLFAAVQHRLKQQAVIRRTAISRSPSLLAGLLYDDRGNRMSPTHANKRGVRYRYYVSQAVLQKRTADIGQVTRVPAPDLEQLVLAGVRQNCGCDAQLPDREVILQHIERSVNPALDCLRLGRKFHRFLPSAKMMIEPWIVELALSRLGKRRLMRQEQVTVVQALRTPHKVRWPDWWKCKSSLQERQPGCVYRADVASIAAGISVENDGPGERAVLRFIRAKDPQKQQQRNELLKTAIEYQYLAKQLAWKLGWIGQTRCSDARSDDVVIDLQSGEVVLTRPESVNPPTMPERK